MPETKTLRGNVPTALGGTRVILVSTKADANPPTGTVLVYDGPASRPVVASVGDAVRIGGATWRVDAITSRPEDASERPYGPGAARMQLTRT